MCGAIKVMSLKNFYNDVFNILNVLLRLFYILYNVI